MLSASQYTALRALVNCPGPEGQKGDRGNDGLDGPTGPRGPTGSSGLVGATGPSGIGTNITDAYSMRGVTETPWFQYAVDGKEWTDSPTAISFSPPTDVAWNGTIWVAGTLSSSSQFAYSNDGKKWNLPSTLQTPFGTKAGAGPRSIVWNGSIWIAVGDPGASPELGDVSVAYSYDGINWTGVFNSYSTVLSNGYGVAWNGSVFVATGAPTSGTNILATSQNGTSWKKVSVSVANSLTQGRCVAWNGKQWLIGGQSSTPSDTKMIYSANLDGSTGWASVIWVGSSTEFANECRSIAWNGSMWVAVGGTPTNPRFTTLARSTNGINWTSVLTNTSSPAFTDGQAVVWNSLYWVATGTNSVYSENGTVWLALSATRAGTSIATRTVQNNTYPVPYINIRHLGALGDGTTSDQKVIDSAIALASNYPTGVTITVPAGRYVYPGSSELQIPSNINFVLEYGATIVNSGGLPINIVFTSPGTGNNVFETRNGEESRISRYDGRSITGSLIHGPESGDFGSSDGVDSTMHDIRYDNAYVSTISTEVYITGFDTTEATFSVVDSRTFRKNQAITFDDTFSGNVSLGTVYYIHATVTGTAFRITGTPNGSLIALTGTTASATCQLYEGDGTLRGLNVRDVLNNSANVAGGNRTVINARFQQEERTSSGAAGSRYVGVSGQSTTISGDSGTGLVKANTRGSYIGGNFYASATGPNSINIATVTGVESSVEVGANAASRHIVGVASVGSVNAAAGGTASANAAYTVGGAVGSNGQNHSGWSTGILFTNLHGQNPMNTSGKLIGSYWDSGDATRIITDGIDLSGFVMTGDVLKSRNVTIKDTDSSISILTPSGTSGTTQLTGSSLTLGSSASTGNSLITTASTGTTLQLRGSTTNGGVEILDHLGTARLTVKASDSGTVLVNPANGITGTTSLGGTEIAIQGVASNSGTTRLTNNGLDLGSTSNVSRIRSVAGTSLVIQPNASGNVRVTNAAGSSDRILSNDTNVVVTSNTTGSVTVTGGDVAGSVTLNTSGASGTILLQNNSTTVATVSSTGLVATGFTATTGIHTIGLTATTDGIYTEGLTATTRGIHTEGLTATTRGIHTEGLTATTRGIHTNGLTATTRGIHTVGLTASGIISLRTSGQNISAINTGAAGILTSGLTATGIHTIGLTATTDGIYTEGLTATTRGIHTEGLTATTRGIHTEGLTATTRGIHTNGLTATAGGIHTTGLTASGIISLKTTGQNISAINTGAAGINTSGITATGIHTIGLTATTDGIYTEGLTATTRGIHTEGLTATTRGIYTIGLTASGIISLKTSGQNISAINTGLAGIDTSGLSASSIHTAGLTARESGIHTTGLTATGIISLNTSGQNITAINTGTAGIDTSGLSASGIHTAGLTARESGIHTTGLTASGIISLKTSGQNITAINTGTAGIDTSGLSASGIHTAGLTARENGIHTTGLTATGIISLNTSGQNITAINTGTAGIDTSGLSASGIHTAGLTARENGIHTTGLTATGIISLKTSGQNITAINTGTAGIDTSGLSASGIHTAGLTARESGIHTTGLTATGIVSLGASTSQNITGINTGNDGLTAGGIVSLRSSASQNITAINTTGITATGIFTDGLTARGDGIYMEGLTATTRGIHTEGLTATGIISLRTTGQNITAINTTGIIADGIITDGFTATNGIHTQNLTATEIISLKTTGQNITAINNSDSTGIRTSGITATGIFTDGLTAGTGGIYTEGLTASGIISLNTTGQNITAISTTGLTATGGIYTSGLTADGMVSLRPTASGINISDITVRNLTITETLSYELINEFADNITTDEITANVGINTVGLTATGIVSLKTTGQNITAINNSDSTGIRTSGITATGVFTDGLTARDNGIYTQGLTATGIISLNTSGPNITAINTTGITATGIFTDGLTARGDGIYTEGLTATTRGIYTDGLTATTRGIYTDGLTASTRGIHTNGLTATADGIYTVGLTASGIISLKTTGQNITAINNSESAGINTSGITATGVFTEGLTATNRGIYTQGLTATGIISLRTTGQNITAINTSGITATGIFTNGLTALTGGIYTDGLTATNILVENLTVTGVITGTGLPVPDFSGGINTAGITATGIVSLKTTGQNITAINNSDSAGINTSGITATGISTNELTAIGLVTLAPTTSQNITGIDTGAEGIKTAQLQVNGLLTLGTLEGGNITAIDTGIHGINTTGLTATSGGIYTVGLTASGIISLNTTGPNITAINTGSDGILTTGLTATTGIDTRGLTATENGIYTTGLTASGIISLNTTGQNITAINTGSDGILTTGLTATTGIDTRGLTATENGIYTTGLTASGIISLNTTGQNITAINTGTDGILTTGLTASGIISLKTTGQNITAINNSESAGIRTSGITATGVFTEGLTARENGIYTQGLTASGIISLNTSGPNITAINTTGITATGVFTTGLTARGDGIYTEGLTATTRGIHTEGLTATGIISLRTTGQNITAINTTGITATGIFTTGLTARGDGIYTQGLTATGIFTDGLTARANGIYTVGLTASGIISLNTTGQNITAINTGNDGILTAGLTASGIISLKTTGQNITTINNSDSAGIRTSGITATGIFTDGLTARENGIYTQGLTASGIISLNTTGQNITAINTTGITATGIFTTGLTARGDGIYTEGLTATARGIHTDGLTATGIISLKTTGQNITAINTTGITATGIFTTGLTARGDGIYTQGLTATGIFTDGLTARGDGIYTEGLTATTRGIYTEGLTATTRGIHTEGLTATGIISLRTTGQNITAINTTGITATGIFTTGLTARGDGIYTEGLTATTRGIHTEGLTATGIISLRTTGQNITAINTTGITATGIFTTGLTARGDGIYTQGLTATNILVQNLTVTGTVTGISLPAPDLSGGITTSGITASGIISLRTTGQNITAINNSDSAGIRTSGITATGVFTDGLTARANGIYTEGLTASGIISLNTTGNNITPITTSGFTVSNRLNIINGYPSGTTMIYSAAAGSEFPTGTNSFGPLTATGGTTGAFREYSVTPSTTVTSSASNTGTVNYSGYSRGGGLLPTSGGAIVNCRIVPGTSIITVPSAITIAGNPTTTARDYNFTIQNSTVQGYVAGRSITLNNSVSVAYPAQNGTTMTNVTVTIAIPDQSDIVLSGCILTGNSAVIYSNNVPANPSLTTGSISYKIYTVRIPATTITGSAVPVTQFNLANQIVTVPAGEPWTIDFPVVTTGFIDDVKTTVIGLNGLSASGIYTGGLTATGGIHTPGLTASGIISLRPTAAGRNISNIFTNIVSTGGSVINGGSISCNWIDSSYVDVAQVISLTSSNTNITGIRTTGMTATGISTATIYTQGLTATGIVSLSTSGGNNTTAIQSPVVTIPGSMSIDTVNSRTIQNGVPIGSAAVPTDMQFNVASGVDLINGTYSVGPFTAAGGTTGAFELYSFAGTRTASVSAHNNTLTIPTSGVTLSGATLPLNSSGGIILRNCRLVQGVSTLFVPVATTIPVGSTVPGYNYTITIPTTTVQTSTAGKSITLVANTSHTGAQMSAGTIISGATVTIGVAPSAIQISNCVLVAGSNIIYSNNVPSGIANNTTVNAAAFQVITQSSSISGTSLTEFPLQNPPTSSPSGLSIDFPVVTTGTIFLPGQPTVADITGIRTTGLTATGIHTTGLTATGIHTTGLTATGIHTTGLTATGIMSLGSAVTQNITGIHTGTAGITAGGIVSLASAATQNITGIHTGTAGITAGGIVSLASAETQNITAINTGSAGISTTNLFATDSNTSRLNIASITTSTIAVSSGLPSNTNLILTTASGVSILNGSYNVGPFTATAGTTGAFSLFSFSETNRPVTIAKNNIITIPSYPANAPKGATVNTTTPSQSITNCRLAAGNTITVPFPITISSGGSIAGTSYTFIVQNNSRVDNVGASSFRLVNSITGTAPDGTILTNASVIVAGTEITGCVLVRGTNTIYSNNVAASGIIVNNTITGATYTVTIPATTLLAPSPTAAATSFSLSTGSITTSHSGLAIEFPVISAGTLGGSYPYTTVIDGSGIKISGLTATGIFTDGLTASGIISLKTTGQNITAINNSESAGINTSGITATGIFTGGLTARTGGIYTDGLTATTAVFLGSTNITTITSGIPTSLTNMEFSAGSGSFVDVAYPVSVSSFTASGGTTGVYALYSFSGTKTVTYTPTKLTIPYPELNLKGATITTTSVNQTIYNCRLVQGESIITVPSAITLNNGTITGGTYTYNITSGTKIIGQVEGVSLTLDRDVVGSGLAQSGTIMSVPSLPIVAGGGFTLTDCILVSNTRTIYSTSVPGTWAISLIGINAQARTLTLTVPSTNLTGNATPSTTFNIGAPITSSQSNLSIVFPTVTSGSLKILNKRITTDATFGASLYPIINTSIPSLTTNGQMVISAIDDTKLAIAYRGTDGTVRHTRLLIDANVGFNPKITRSAAPNFPTGDQTVTVYTFGASNSSGFYTFTFTTGGAPLIVGMGIVEWNGSALTGSGSSTAGFGTGTGVAVSGAAITFNYTGRTTAGSGGSFVLQQVS